MWAGLLESRDLPMCSGIKHNHPKKRKRRQLKCYPMPMAKVEERKMRESGWQVGLKNSERK